jgi:hypothetical protein
LVLALDLQRRRREIGLASDFLNSFDGGDRM